MIIHEREVKRDPLGAVRMMLAMLRVIQERDAAIARLEQDSASAWCRVGELEERVALLEEDNAALDQTLTDTEGRLREWETAADVVGPVGRPS